MHVNAPAAEVLNPARPRAVKSQLLDTFDDLLNMSFVSIEPRDFRVREPNDHTLPAKPILPVLLP